MNSESLPLRWKILVPIALAFAVLCAIVLAVSGPGNRLGWWDYRTAFSIFGFASWAGLAAMVLCFAAGLVVASRWGTGMALALAGVVLGALTYALPVQLRARGQTVPPIHDISTDTSNPPRFTAILPLRKGAPNSADYGGPAVAAMQQRGYPDIGPLTVAVPPQEAFERALAAARRAGWEIVSASAVTRTIEATATTPFFGFKDDVIIRVNDAAGGGSRIDMRSVSRVGRGDMGTNARRIRTFLRGLS
jgi:uncharacterized protein (DUF1499 family)